MLCIENGQITSGNLTFSKMIVDPASLGTLLNLFRKNSDSQSDSKLLDVTPVEVTPVSPTISYDSIDMNYKAYWYMQPEYGNEHPLFKVVNHGKKWKSQAFRHGLKSLLVFRHIVELPNDNKPNLGHVPEILKKYDNVLSHLDDYCSFMEETARASKLHNPGVMLGMFKFLARCSDDKSRAKALLTIKLAIQCLLTGTRAAEPQTAQVAYVISHYKTFATGVCYSTRYTRVADYLGRRLFFTFNPITTKLKASV